MASGSKSQEDEGPEAYFEAALTFFPSTSSNPDGSLSTLELQDVDKQRGATTADMLLADGPSMEVPVQDLPEISPPTKDPTKEPSKATTNFTCMSQTKIQKLNKLR